MFRSNVLPQYDGEEFRTDPILFDWKSHHRDRNKSNLSENTRILARNIQYIVFCLPKDKEQVTYVTRLTCSTKSLRRSG